MSLAWSMSGNKKILTSAGVGVPGHFLTLYYLSSVVIGNRGIYFLSRKREKHSMRIVVAKNIILCWRGRRKDLAGSFHTSSMFQTSLKRLLLNCAKGHRSLKKCWMALGQQFSKCDANRGCRKHIGK